LHPVALVGAPRRFAGGRSGRSVAPPDLPWVLGQRWEDLLFAHWKVPVDGLRAKVPAPLTLDLHDGQAWLGVTPFRLRRMRVRGLPPIPGTSEFPELNVRTYVVMGDRPGVYFFSLDAGNPLAALAARQFYRLPYFASEMACESDGSRVTFRCRRGGGEGAPGFAAAYGPRGAAFESKRGTVEHFLTARYCLYAVEGDAVYRTEVDHEPWPLQDAEAEIAENSIVSAAGFDLPRTGPLLHFSRGVDVRVWPPQRVGGR
jgi:uncharacterized protein YqjF (DUF2071 family)